MRALNLLVAMTESIVEFKIRVLVEPLNELSLKRRFGHEVVA